MKENETTQQVEQENPFAEMQELGAIELMQGVTVEEMKSVFFDADALIEPPYKIFQLNSKGHRYYYRFDDNNNPEFFPSVTTILSQTMPNNPFLTKWVASMGYDEAERYKLERASYGTFMHSQFERLLIEKTYDLDSLNLELKKYIEANRLPIDFINYADELKKDMLAFARFVLDYDVKPLAVEIALVHPTYKYAGMLDLPCTMLERAGSDKRITAIVDFKSGRKGFYPDHEVQLHLYKMMWEANFENHPIDKVFNFAPKDWRKYPTYHLKDQTDSIEAKKIPYLLELAAIEDSKRDNTFTACNGFISLESKDLTPNVTNLTLAELVKTKTKKEEEKPTGEKAVNEQDLTPVEAVKKAKKTTKVKKTVAKVEKKTKRTTKKAATKPKTKKAISSKESKKEAVKTQKTASLLNSKLDF